MLQSAESAGVPGLKSEPTPAPGSYLLPVRPLGDRELFLSRPCPSPWRGDAGGAREGDGGVLIGRLSVRVSPCCSRPDPLWNDLLSRFWLELSC